MATERRDNDNYKSKDNTEISGRFSESSESVDHTIRGNREGNGNMHGGVHRSSHPPRTLISLNPSSFIDTFDAIDELHHNRELYIGDHCMSLYGVPQYCRFSIDSIRSKTSRKSKPGISATVGCLISNGISVIKSNEHIVNLVSLRDKLFTSNNINEWEAEELFSWMRSFTASILDTSVGGTSRINIRTSLEISNEVSTLAYELGMSQSILSTLSMVVTLSTQSSYISDSHIRVMSEAVSMFFRRAELRYRVGQAFLDAISKKPKTKKRILGRDIN